MPPTVGDVYIDPVAAAPPARTHWHRHPLSQTVFVTEGDGHPDSFDDIIEAKSAAAEAIDVARAAALTPAVL